MACAGDAETMMPLSFRAATPADAPLLADLNQRLIRDEGHRNAMTLAELEQRMAGWLVCDYEAVLFELDGAPVGYALYRREQDHVYLRQFYVDRGFRRRGIGRAACDRLRRGVWAGAARIRLDVLVGNAPGRAFWKAMGFEEYCLTLECDAPATPPPEA